MWIKNVCLVLFCLYTCCQSVDFTYHVKEGSQPGTYLGDIGVNTHLMDSVSYSDHSLIRFSQLQKDITGSSQLFNVSQRGKLYTSKPIDSESLCKYNTECFRMVDIAVRKGKSFIKILEIKVIIEDVNDHQPEFPVRQIKVQFDEGDGKGMTKSIPNAIDSDVGVLNSQITYKLRNSDLIPFKLAVSKRADGSYSLGITLENKLDREKKDTYKLQVIAKDGGSPPKEGVLNVEISVSDINDNQPVFSQSIYYVTINNRTLKRTPIVTLSANDLDAKRNGKISFHFSSKTSDIAKSYFKLNENSGEIFLDEKFKQVKKTYKLFIEARDGGIPPLSSVATVLVNVLDKQNNSPTIDVNFSELTGNTAIISEDIEVGSFIAYVKVTDNDIGNNGKVTCELFHENLQLKGLSEKRYKVIVKAVVDRETKDKLDFVITCKDHGSPPLKREKRFFIKVMDANDVQPHFTKDTFKFLTYENEKTDFPVGFINATDPDLGSGGQLSYTLSGHNEGILPFQISNFGFISTTQPLDHEQQEVYKFKVLVTDNGTPALNNEANVIVEVMDENDNAPYFIFPSVNPFTLDVYYQPQSKNDITVLRASDRDSRQNAFLRYEIFGGNGRMLFKVNPYTGVLSFSRTVYQNDAGTYNLELSVKDSGTPVLSTTTTLSITLSVSNTTSKLLASVNMKSDAKIHINLFIIIIIAAVAVSVLLVISITVCIVRRSNQRNAIHRTVLEPSNNLLDDNRQTEYLCAKQMSSKQEESSQSRTQSIIEIHSQTLKKGTHQYSQQESKTSDGWKDKVSIVNAPYCYSEMAPMIDCVQGSSTRDMQHLEDLLDYKSYESEKFQLRDRKCSPQTYSISSSNMTDSSTKSSCQSGNAGNNKTDFCAGQKATSLSSSTNCNFQPQLWNLPTKNSFTTYSKPLPAVPKLQDA